MKWSVECRDTHGDPVIVEYDSDTNRAEITVVALLDRRRKLHIVTGMTLQSLVWIADNIRQWVGPCNHMPNERCVIAECNCTCQLCDVTKGHP